MEIKKLRNGYVLKKDGVEFKLTWAEFWDVVTCGLRADTRCEVEEYFDGYGDAECLEVFGLMPDVILSEPFIDKVVQKVIDIRINGETTEDIYDAVEAICKNGK